jgi:hypothetical protein
MVPILSLFVPAPKVRAQGDARRLAGKNPARIGSNFNFRSGARLVDTTESRSTKAAADISPLLPAHLGRDWVKS